MKNKLMNLAGVLLLLGLQIAAGELLLAVFFTLHQDYDAEMWKYTRDLKRNTMDPRGHHHLPNAKARLMGVEIRTNSLGWRGPELNSSRPHYRLLALGDSFTLGWGVPEERTFPRLIQKNLSDRCGKAEVVNAGVGNYNLAQINELLERDGAALDPNAILYGFYWNDAEPTQHEPDSWLERHSHLALFWRKIQVRLLHYGARKDTYLDYYSKTFKGESWDAYAAAAARLAALARQRKIPLYVTLLPELRERHNPAVREAYRKVEALFRGLGARTINLEEEASFPGAPRSYWVDQSDPHPNAEAQEIIAASSLKEFWAECP